MKTRRFQKGILVLFIALSTACGTNIQKKEVLITAIENTKAHFAPDKRTALFDIVILEGPSDFTLTGESNLPNAIDSLKARLKADAIEFKDEIRMLPSEELEGKTHAVINISVANLRSDPKHSAELATQATLGTIVKVLKKENSWYLIQTPDDYLAWVDAGGIELIEPENLENWSASEKIIYTNTYGHAYDSISTLSRVSDLVAGNLLKLKNVSEAFYEVEFPDGRPAFVPKTEADEYTNWLSNLTMEADALVETSKTLMGVPYLWGGTSTKGVDCSGFTKTVYYLNGMIIPRDASQQVHTGKFIDSIANFDALEKGDLLFFGRKATDTSMEKVVHVGMWIGNNEFIHSSDRVRISSVDADKANYDAYNVGRYLRSKRILKPGVGNVLNLKMADTILN